MFIKANYILTAEERPEFGSKYNDHHANQVSGLTQDLRRKIERAQREIGRFSVY